MTSNDLGRLLIIVGGSIIVLGVIVLLLARIPALGHLPGDIVFQRGGVTVIVPLATMVLISVVLTVLLNILGRLLG